MTENTNQNKERPKQYGIPIAPRCLKEGNETEFVSKRLVEEVTRQFPGDDINE